jgi:hypothetical protein
LAVLAALFRSPDENGDVGMDLLDLVNNKLSEALHFSMQYFDNPLIILICVAVVVSLSIALIHQKD